MPKQSLEQLYREIKQEGSAVQGYEAFLEAMEALNTELRSLMEPDATGWKLMDGPRTEKLAALYRNAGIALEQLLANSREAQVPADHPQQQKLRLLAELMAEDSAAFRRYNPRSQAELKSLPTILEEARIPVVDLGTTQLASMDGDLSSRFPMTVVGPDGRYIPGVFTMAEVFDPLKDINGVLRQAANRTGPEGKALLTGFMDRYRAYYTQNPDAKHSVASVPAMVNGFLQSCKMYQHKRGDTTMSEALIVGELSKVSGKSPQEVKTLLGKQGMEALKAGMDEIAFGIYIKTEEVGMTNLTRVDRKNAGMSRVAELLGMQDIICRAHPMKLRGPKGGIIDGTFMEMAIGEDPSRPGANGFHVNQENMRNSPQLLEKIASLQALDYICGNVDRHGYNMSYQANVFDGFYGLQGFDNDSSFGTRVEQKRTIHKLTIPNNMRVLGKKAADAIMRLNPSELSFALRGLVDEPAIDAACKRLYVLQKNIEHSRQMLKPGTELQRPYIRELETQDFGKLDFQALISKEHPNHFGEIARTVDNVRGSAMNVRDATRKMPTLLGSVNRATAAGVVGQLRQAQRMKKLLSDCCSFWRGSSGENYLKLQQSVQDYLRQQEELRDRLAKARKQVKEGSESPAVISNQYVGRFDLEKMKQSMQRIQEAADRYVNDKLQELQRRGKRPEDDSYVHERIKAAQSISQYAVKQQTISPEEQEFLASNQRQALEQITRANLKNQQNEPQPQDKAPVMPSNLIHP
ncbi:MAG: hypothetical protein IKS05_10940 [Oscillospiraceae bacterium]|nr:hypothetical protein [Oscillospiraceae bacterium]